MVSDRKPAKFFLQTQKTPHSPHNIYQNQSKRPAAENRRTAREEDARQRRQDKGHLEHAPAAAGQPAPLFKGTGARAVKTKNPRTQKTLISRGKLIHSTVHFEPLVRFDMERFAEEKGHSFSQAVNDACKFYAGATLEEKYQASLSTQLRQIIREELAAFGHRMVYFLLRIAFAAEHGRLLITNVLKILLQSRGRYDQKQFTDVVNNTAKTAKRNILRNNPQMQAALAAYWASFTADGTQPEDLSADRQDKEGST